MFDSEEKPWDQVYCQYSSISLCKDFFWQILKYTYTKGTNLLNK